MPTLPESKNQGSRAGTSAIFTTSSRPVALARLASPRAHRVALLKSLFRGSRLKIWHPAFPYGRPRNFFLRQKQNSPRSYGTSGTEAESPPNHPSRLALSTAAFRVFPSSPRTSPRIIGVLSVKARDRLDFRKHRATGVFLLTLWPAALVSFPATRPRPQRSRHSSELENRDRSANDFRHSHHGAVHRSAQSVASCLERLRFLGGCPAMNEGVQCRPIA